MPKECPRGLRSKSWDEFVDAAPMDLVITVMRPQRKPARGVR
jgi:hypothetical protein